METNYFALRDNKIVYVPDVPNESDFTSTHQYGRAGLFPTHTKMRTVIFLLLTVIFFSCTDAQRSKIGGLGNKFKVEMINCDGSVAKSWVSSGKVLSEKGSDGYYFNDSETGKLIEVTGRIIITEL